MLSVLTEYTHLAGKLSQEGIEDDIEEARNCTVVVT